mmetsp:Transcript_35359/g.87888  ORF Transcript_35359/g.87888 Transcript_35359/m.87888 type:complete len:95 (+) Transcript_35359:59-343(+)
MDTHTHTHPSINQSVCCTRLHPVGFSTAATQRATQDDHNTMVRKENDHMSPPKNGCGGGGTHGGVGAQAVTARHGHHRLGTNTPLRPSIHPYIT